MGYPALAPYTFYTDTNGEALDAGYLYFGVANLNPQTNPISIYWDQALTIPAAQPVRTSGGFAVRNGTPANIFTAGDFSITVRDSQGVFLYTRPTAPEFNVPKSLFATSDVAGTNTITADADGLLAYAENQLFILVPVNTTTGATTLNINSLGAKNVFRFGAACTGGELTANVPAVLEYDGTQLNIIGPSLGSTRSWTPVDVSGAGLSLTVQSASFTDNGRVKIAEYDVTYPATADATAAALGGLPVAFASSAAGNHPVRVVGGAWIGGIGGGAATTRINFVTQAADASRTNADLSEDRLIGTVIYGSA